MSPKKQLQILRSQWTFLIPHVVLPTFGLFPSAFRQGGYCHVSGSKAELTSYPISFTVAGFPVPRVFSQGHYVDFANVTEKDNHGFYATGAINVNSWVAHDGWYIAIGW